MSAGRQEEPAELAEARERDAMREVLERHRERAGELFEELRNLGARLDQRWVSIAQTHFQQGIMAARRAIDRPRGF